MDDSERVRLLIGIVEDAEEQLETRDDAAIQLGRYPSNEGLRALIRVASDPTTDEYLLENVGESIGELWETLGAFDCDTFRSLRPSAQREARRFVDSHLDDCE